MAKLKLSLVYTLFVYALVNTPSVLGATDCYRIMELHGFLTRSQFTCPFKKYGQELLDSARACRSRLSEGATREALMSGMRTFDDRAKEWGLQQLCKKVLEDFPGFVGN